MIPIILLTTATPSTPVPLLTKMENVHYLARIISAEAISQHRMDMICVGTVILNRAAKENKTVLEVISAPGQFPGYLTDLYKHPQPIHYKAARDMAYHNVRADFGSEVLYYLNPNHATNNIFAAWVMQQELVQVNELPGTEFIHHYYKEIK